MLWLQAIAAACLFLAGKVEETPKKARDLFKQIQASGLIAEQAMTSVFGDDVKVITSCMHFQTGNLVHVLVEDQGYHSVPLVKISIFCCIILNQARFMSHMERWFAQAKVHFPREVSTLGASSLCPFFSLKVVGHSTNELHEKKWIIGICIRTQY